jgi:hypothetical protein
MRNFVAARFYGRRFAMRKTILYTIPKGALSNPSEF